MTLITYDKNTEKWECFTQAVRSEQQRFNNKKTRRQNGEKSIRRKSQHRRPTRSSTDQSVSNIFRLCWLLILTLDFCISAHYDASKYSLKRLQSILHESARLILNVPRNNRISRHLIWHLFPKFRSGIQKLSMKIVFSWKTTEYSTFDATSSLIVPDNSDQGICCRKLKIISRSIWLFFRNFSAFFINNMLQEAHSLLMSINWSMSRKTGPWLSTKADDEHAECDSGNKPAEFMLLRIPLSLWWREFHGLIIKRPSVKLILRTRSTQEYTR